MCRQISNENNQYPDVAIIADLYVFTFLLLMLNAYWHACTCGAASFQLCFHTFANSSPRFVILPSKSTVQPSQALGTACLATRAVKATAAYPLHTQPLQRTLSHTHHAGLNHLLPESYGCFYRQIGKGEKIMMCYG